MASGTELEDVKLEVLSVVAAEFDELDEFVLCLMVGIENPNKLGASSVDMLEELDAVLNDGFSTEVARSSAEKDKRVEFLLSELNDFV